MRHERIGNIAQFINGAPFKPEDWCEIGMKIIRIQNLTDPNKPYNKTNRIIDKKYIVTKGDVLVSWSATIDVFTWEDEDALLNQHIFKVIFDKSKVDKSYFIIALKETINKLTKFAHGATMKHVVKGDFENHKIPLPPIPIQLHIANLLSKAEGLITQRKQSIALLDEYLKSTFLEMFGNFKEMSISKLDFLGDNISYLTSGSRGWAKYYSLSGAKFLRIQNIGGGRIRKDNLIYVNPPDSAEAERTRVKEGDLLISITADLGRTSVVPKDFGEAYINQHLALIRLNKNINPIYAAYFYNMPFGNNAILKKNRSAVKAGLNFNDIKSFPIFIPSMACQLRFVQIVEKNRSSQSSIPKQFAGVGEFVWLYKPTSVSGRIHAKEIQLNRKSYFGRSHYK